jgi:hypothetical protein
MLEVQQFQHKCILILYFHVLSDTECLENISHRVRRVGVCNWTGGDSVSAL